MGQNYNMFIMSEMNEGGGEKNNTKFTWFGHKAYIHT